MQQQQTVNIFIAYARGDKLYLDKMLTFLKALTRAKILDKIWCDQDISAGEEWKKAIDDALEKADIFLLMLSADFIASDFCYGIEMKHALSRHEKGDATIIPIVVRDCNIKYTPLSDFQAPMEGKAIASNAEREDYLYAGIVDEIGEVALKIRTQKELTRLQAQEDEYWQKVQTDNKISTYQKYIKTYPNGKYVQNAEAFILAILQKQETAFWDKIIAQKKMPTAGDYQKYLEKYPNGKYAAEALKAIENIKQKELDAAKARDNKAWQAAQSANSKEAYQNYLERFPNGLHQVNAKAAIQKLTLLIPEMVFVKGGTYKDKLIKDFHIGKYPVTNEEYAFFLNHYGSDVVKIGEFENQEMFAEHEWSLKKEEGIWQAQKGYERHPIICVNWYGANEYCNWLKGETGENYALPSEWYWEYAASGGQKSKGFKYAGSNDLDEVAWYDENSDQQTHQVGQKDSNELNTHDMSGNVWEWCEEVWNNNDNRRFVRGGSWFNYAISCRVAIRIRYYSDNRINNVGFRVARY